ncbi:glycosyltransferase family 4 protein [Aquabacterium sp. OR-4]|uniref:glycosyltransferase family 4 protein n=1 Tax=Aquabacterium sp. OR-4 TaxID=2978127 RepID=UPI0021B2E936|nr:glycosyltransferase family 4 protein [Aquabacterium sp. OR-4]MDT7835861.1 glycosyltransferase family 4 protein [Aquabacterium sp. OR-4]
MRHILVVHHDADLYGADQSLLRSLRAMRRHNLHPVVVLPHQGPLIQHIVEMGIEVHIGPVGKISRQLTRPAALPKLLASLVRSVSFIDRVVAGRPIELVYSNSVGALGGALWAWRRGVKRLWHVREIVVSPRIAAAGFPRLLRWLGGWCICNSGATRQWIADVQPVLAQRSSVLWNGIERVPQPTRDAVAALRARLGLTREHTVVTLVGRINRWKGQGVFIEAAAQLAQAGQHPQLRFLIVGDVADGQHHFREDMLARIQALGLADTVLWHPFTPEVDTVWAASDIAAAPSTDPEPFGRVAIEAMAHGLPVVAAGHGGLAEIVAHQQTGLLVKPGDATELAQAIGRLAASRELRKQYGAAGQQRQIEFFSQDEHDRRLMSLLDDLAAGRQPATTPLLTSA